MTKTFLTNHRGSTLLLVLGVVMVVSIMVIPLTLTLNSGLTQSVADGNYENANAKSESLTIVYRRLIQAAISSGLQNNDLRDLANKLKDDPANPDSALFKDIIDVRILPDTGNPSAIEITTSSGSGPSKREKKVVFNFKFNPASGSGGGGYEGPGENSTGTEFYHTKPVVIKPSAYNKYFKVCGGVPTPNDFVENQYETAKYETEFNNYIEYYQNVMSTEALKPRPAIVPVMPANPQEIITYDGAKGTINGDLITTGNINFNGWTGTLVINGNLIAKGNITFNGLDKLTITGNVIAGGDIAFKGNSANITVEGTMSGKSITHGGGSTLTIGKWDTNNKILNNNFSSLIAKEKLTIGGLSSLNVSGDISSGAFSSTGQISNLRTGGSFITAGDLGFNSALTLAVIGGNLSVGKEFRIKHITTLDIKKSLYVGTTLTFDDTVTDLKVGGSLYANGNIVFTMNVTRINIAGDFVTNDSLKFKDVFTGGFKVGGLLMVKNDLSFINHIPKPQDVNQFGGFYVGGKLDVANYATGSFCINHNPPPIGGGDVSSIEFGNWTGN